MEDMLIPSTEDGWATLKDKLTGWYENILLYLPNILLAILALVIFLFLGRLLSRLVSEPGLSECSDQYPVRGYYLREASDCCRRCDSLKWLFRNG
jgi:hypothetical protein